MRRAAVPGAIVTGWALLLLAWVFGNPPFAAPDETDHYVRAIGVAEGELVGREAPGAAAGATERQRAWTRQAIRAVDIPAGLVPGNCSLLDAKRPASCEQGKPGSRTPVPGLTSVGTYQPLPYLLPGAVVELADSTDDAVRLARLADAAIALVLLAVGLLVLWDPDNRLTAVGPVVAVTPMVLFTGSTLNGSGLEVAAGVAFFASIVRLMRASAPGRAAWAAAGGSGAVLALSRSTGPVWLVLGVVLLVAGLGPRPAWDRLRGGGAAAYAAGAALVAGAVLNRVWEALYGPEVNVTLTGLRGAVGEGLRETWHAADDIVGQFGYLEFSLPPPVPLVWLVGLLGLLAAAVAVGRRRERTVLVAAAGVVLVLPVLLYVAVTRDTGFGVQGRHVLPAAVAVPLLAGDVVARRREALTASARRVLMALPVLVGLVQVAAFYFNARRAAVGTAGPVYFLDAPAWEPPLGWWVWLSLAALGALCLAVSGFLSPRRAPRPGHRRPQ